MTVSAIMSGSPKIVAFTLICGGFNSAIKGIGPLSNILYLLVQNLIKIFLMI
jgi:uncharacterized ion transporter superfamily protein YfcC